MLTDDTWIKVVVGRGGDAMGTQTSTNREKLVNVQEQHPYGLALYVTIQCVSCSQILCQKFILLKILTSFLCSHHFPQ